MPRTSHQLTAALLTLGCKLNIADSEAMARRLRQAGWRVTGRPGPADAVIVNSCSVTSMADQKSRHLLSLARRAAPEATIAFTGCTVETATRTEIDALQASLIYRQPDQAALTDHLIALHPTPTLSTAVIERPALKTRAFIAAQEGCNDVCAFCVIPRTRGRERSKPIAAVVAEAQEREAEGVQEIVITGTQLGAYGRDRGERVVDGKLIGRKGIAPLPYASGGAGDLAELIGALLRSTAVPRIRISSIQPQDISPALIDLWQEPRLCRHLHLALQSGSETVLQRMRRRYSAFEYASAVDNLRDRIPDVAITTDIIAGFPGETETEFEETFSFCRGLAFAATHVFPYSPRVGTSAVKLPDPVAEPVKRARVRRLIGLGEGLTAAYQSRFIGATTTVLWEACKDEVWEGLTDTYIRVRTLASGDDLHNRMTRVRLAAAYEGGLLGEVVT